MTRAWLVAIVAATALGCGTRPCKEGSAFLTVAYDPTAAHADTLEIQVTLDGVGSMAFTRTPSGTGTDTFEIDLPTGSYRTGAALTVAISARAAGRSVGMGGPRTIPLAPGCTALALEVVAAAAVDAGTDGGPGDLLPVADAAPVDLSIDGASDGAALADLAIVDAAPTDLATADLAAADLATADLTAVDATLARPDLAAPDLAAAPGTVLLYGGTDGSGGASADTWSWNGASWSLRSSTTPSARIYYGMTYDSARHRVVLFGGETVNGSQVFAETWEWDGASWSLRVPKTTTPKGRVGSPLAFDSARGRVVLFGGDNGGLLGDTCEWDGVDWSCVTPASSPSPRYAHALAYDAARHRVVLFGGSTAEAVQPSSIVSETWEWDGATWSLISSSTPSARTDVAMAFDGARGRLVLFGGDFATTPLGDTCERSGTAWSCQTPSGSPPPRYSHATAYDASRGVTVVHGGSNHANALGDVWEWDGTRWRQPMPASPPSARYLAAAAFFVP